MKSALFERITTKVLDHEFAQIQGQMIKVAIVNKRRRTKYQSSHAAVRVVNEE